MTTNSVENQINLNFSTINEIFHIICNTQRISWAEHSFSGTDIWIKNSCVTRTKAYQNKDFMCISKLYINKNFESNTLKNLKSYF